MPVDQLTAIIGKVDAATAGLAGAAIGAAVTLIGTFGTSMLQSRRDRAARRQDAIAQLEKERRLEYVNLLVTTRELRYIAFRTFQHRATRPVGEVDALLTQLSAAYYKIALTAPQDTRQLAWDLRESVFEVWRKARDHPDSGRYQDDMKQVRDLTAKFRSHVAAELNLTGVSREEDSELSPVTTASRCAAVIWSLRAFVC